MKNLLSFIFFLLGLEVFGQPLQYNRFATTPDGNSVNGSVLTNLYPGSLNNSTSVALLTNANNSFNGEFTNSGGIYNPTGPEILGVGGDYYVASGGLTGSNMMHSGNINWMNTNQATFFAPQTAGGTVYYANGSLLADSIGGIYGNGTGLTNLNAQANNIIAQNIMFGMVPVTTSNSIGWRIYGTGTPMDGLYLNPTNCNTFQPAVITNLGAQYTLGVPIYWTEVGGTINIGMNIQFPNAGGTFWAISANTNLNHGNEYYELYASIPTNAPQSSPWQAGPLSLGGNLPQVSYTANADIINGAISAAAAVILPIVGVPAVNYINTNKDWVLSSSAAAMSGQNPNGEIWSSITRPFVSIYFSPYVVSTPFVPQDTETSITNILNWCNVSNIFSQFAASGYRWDAYIDIGWDARRNINGNYCTTNLGYPNGALTWDTNLFPDGIPFMANVVHSMSGLLSLGIYDTTNIIPQAATGLAIPQSGGSFGNVTPYTNGVGPGGLVYSNSVYKYVEVVNLATVPFDATEMHWWGVDALVLNDLQFTPNAIYALERATSEGILNPPIVTGFNNAGATNGPALIQAGIVNGYPVSPTNMNVAAMALGAKTFTQKFTLDVFSNAMMYFPFQSDQGVDQHVAGDVLRKYDNGFVYENDASQVGAAELREYGHDFPSITKSYNGGYAHIQIGGGTDVRAYDAIAMLHANVIISAAPNSRTNLILTALTYLTNSGFVACWQDVQQNTPKYQTLYGTNGSTWVDQLSDGSYACYIENEGLTTTNLTLNFPPQFTNQICQVKDVWSGGTITNGVNSFATNMTAGQSCLLKVTPIIVLGNGSGLTSLNGANITGTIPQVAIPSLPQTQVTNANWLTTNGNGGLLTGLNAAQLTSGTVPAAAMPALTGDVTTTAGAVATTLKTTGTAGTYTKTTFDANGRETSGTTLASADMPSSVVQTNSSNQPLMTTNVVTAIIAGSNVTVSATTNSGGITYTVNATGGGSASSNYVALAFGTATGTNSLILSNNTHSVFITASNIVGSSNSVTSFALGLTGSALNGTGFTNNNTYNHGTAYGNVLDDLNADGSSIVNLTGFGLEMNSPFARFSLGNGNEVLVQGSSGAGSWSTAGGYFESGTFLGDDGFYSTTNAAVPVSSVTDGIANGTVFYYTNQLSYSILFAFQGAVGVTIGLGSTNAASSFRQWPMSVTTAAYVPMRPGAICAITNTTQPTLLVQTPFP